MRKARILIIYDDNLTGGFIRSNLESRDYSVISARNEKELLKIIDDDLADLILIDMSFQFAASYSICSKIRQYSELPVIILSDPNNINELTGFDIGADDFMIKPFSMEILASRIKGLLRRSWKYKPEIAANDIATDKALAKI